MVKGGRRSVPAVGWAEGILCSAGPRDAALGPSRAVGWTQNIDIQLAVIWRGGPVTEVRDCLR